VDNVKTVEEIYAAFGRGDIPAVLDQMADDVRWEEWSDSFAQRAEVPELLPRTGRDGVASFFQAIADWEITELQVLDILASGSQVAAEIVIAASNPQGGAFRDEEMHLWTFDADGRVCRLRHYVDTAKHIAAWQGEDTTVRP
jgi:ketosteroid isomerase-like protein